MAANDFDFIPDDNNFGFEPTESKGRASQGAPAHDRSFLKDLFNTLKTSALPFPLNITQQPPVQAAVKSQLKPEAMERGVRVPAAGWTAGIQQGANLTTNLANQLLGTDFNQPFPKKNLNEYLQDWGVENPNALDKAVGGAFQYAPEMITEMGTRNFWPALALSGGTGAFYGAKTNPEEPAWGATKGAAVNLGTLGTMGGLGKIEDALKNYFSKYTGSGISKNLATDLEKAAQTDTQAGFDMAKGQYDKAATAEKEAWGRTQDIANQGDKALLTGTSQKSPGMVEEIQFNASPYDDYINQYLQDIKGMSPAKRANYDEAVEFAQEMKELAPQNLEDVVILRQNLNDHLDKFARKRNLDKPDKQTKDFVQKLKNNLIDETVNANKSQYTPEFIDEFRSAWENANKATQNKKRTFLETSSAKGKSQESIFKNLLSNPNSDQTAFMKDFLPKSGEKGIERMQKLSNVVGDEEAAKNLLKQDLFKNVLKDDGMDVKKFLTGYKKLSPTQRDYLFSPEQQRQVRALDKIVDKYGNNFDQSKLRLFGHYSVPTLMGMWLGRGVGLPWEAGGLAGLIGSHGAEKGLSKFFSNPKRADALISSLLEETPSAVPKWLNRGRAALPFLTPKVAGGQ